MKKLTTWLLVFLLISLLPAFMPDVKAAPSIWYVATTGSDTASGDIGHPLLTLSKAINKSSNSDIIYMRGGKYNKLDSATYGFRINRSGTKAQPFTIATYPADLVAGNRAIIDASAYTLAAYYGTFNFYRLGVYYSNITLNGLTIENSSGDAIYIAGDSAGRTNDIIINNCYFNNIHSRAISVLQFNVATKGCLENIIVSNCTFWKTQAGLTMGESITFAGVKNFVFENNTILWARTIGLDIGSQSNHGRVNNNNFHINESELTVGAISSIYLNGMDHNDQTVSYIDIYNNVFWGTIIPGASANAIALAGEASTGYCFNINIYNNIINISADSGEEANGIRFADIAYDATHAPVHYNNITIKFNTIYCRNGNSYPIRLIGTVATTHDIIIANNILITAGSSLYQFRSFYITYNSPELIRENNLYWSTSRTSNNNFVGTTGDITFEVTAVRANPEFVSLATYDFHLNQTSQAIDRETTTYPISFDYEGKVRPVLSGYDIGAYEYRGSGSGDTTSPVISQVGVVTSSPIDTLAGYGWENFSCVVTDNVGVSTVLLKFTNSDQSITYVPMVKKTGTTTYYTNQSLHQEGNYSYSIQATDTSNNVALSSNLVFSMPPNWDVNSDGVVTMMDLVLISNQYGKTGIYGWIREDVDNNGNIEVLDMVLITSHFGESWLL